MIEFWLCIERKPQYYLLNIIVPTMVLALLLVLTFLAPVDSGEKLSVGISILLAFSVFMLLLSEITPQSSDNSALLGNHYSDVIMGGMASQITGVTIVYSAVCSGADERKHQSSTSLAFVRRIHRWLLNSPLTKSQWRGKCFHLMTSSWWWVLSRQLNTVMWTWDCVPYLPIKPEWRIYSSAN